MLGAILLVLIGSADLIRVGIVSRVGRAVTIVIVWAVVVILAITGLGIAAWWITIPILLAAAWLVTTTASIDRRAGPGILPAIGVALAIVAFLIWDRTSLALDGFIVDWHEGVVSRVVSSLPLPALAMAMGVALFAVESSNIIVRAALRPAASAARSVVMPPAQLAWWKRSAAPAFTVVDLRGGRLIGPVERLLIIALTLAGALPIVAGLIAAKGIVRFPEISNDGANGSKAEYFLVGSFVSWAIATASTGLVWLAAVG